MTFKFNRPDKSEIFTVKSKNLGPLRCSGFFSAYTQSETQDWLRDNEEQSSVELARYLMTRLCWLEDEYHEKNNDISTVGDPGLSSKQAKQLTLSEIQVFSREFLSKNKHLLGDIGGKASGANMVLVQKSRDETDSDYLMRVLTAYIDRFNERYKDVFKKATRSIFSASTQNLLDKNKRASAILGASLKSYTPMDLPHVNLPENPVMKTNRQLANFGKELKDVAALIKNMNDLGVGMALDSAVASARTERWNRKMLCLGLLTLLITAVFSAVSYFSSVDSSQRFTQTISEQNELLRLQTDNQEKVVLGLSELQAGITERLTYTEEEPQPKESLREPVLNKKTLENKLLNVKD